MRITYYDTGYYIFYLAIDVIYNYLLFAFRYILLIIKLPLSISLVQRFSNWYTYQLFNVTDPQYTFSILKKKVFENLLYNVS